MNANEFGKRLGIGVRIAGRIAQQRAPIQSQTQSQTAAQPAPLSQATQIGPIPRPSARQITEKTHLVSRAAGRGVGGFLRPFGRVGGILWLEVTGFFFALFALWFAQTLYRTRLSYATGPDHQRFLFAAALTVVFTYLSASAFWRARRR